MSLKIAKVTCETMKSFMTSPLAKTIGIGAIFGAGVLIGKGGIGFDSFEKTNKTEVTDSINTPKTAKNAEEAATIERTEQREQTEEAKKGQEVKNKVADLKKVIEELDNLPVENTKTITKFAVRSYGDSQYLHANKYNRTEGTVNYNGTTFRVEMDDYGDKGFYDNKGNCVYEFDNDSFNKYASFNSYKYDENNRLVEEVSNFLSGHVNTYKYVNTESAVESQYTYVDVKGQTRNNNVTEYNLNKFTHIKEGDEGDIDFTIKDKNGHFVKSHSAISEYEKVNIKNGKIVDINGFAMKYDKNGYLIRNEFNKETYTYDANGNIKEVVRDEEWGKIKHTFKYDEQNNLIDINEVEILK